MYPGAAFFSARGGFGQGFGGGMRHTPGAISRLGAPVADRALGHLPGARRQRFFVDDEGAGHLEVGDRLVLEVDKDGGVTIALESPKSSNGSNGNEKSRRSLPEDSGIDRQ
jgi:hypothetical protein